MAKYNFTCKVIINPLKTVVGEQKRRKLNEELGTAIAALEFIEAVNDGIFMTNDSVTMEMIEEKITELFKQITDPLLNDLFKTQLTYLSI